MPIKVKSDLPAKTVIEKENIFIMDENRAISQDIRPLEIGLLNLMPLKTDTEIQMLRSLSNTPIQLNMTFIAVSGHVTKNTPANHLQQFYKTFNEIKDHQLDGLIITGAPLELMEYEEVDYWNELTEIMDWSEENTTSTMFVCWSAQAAFYHFYGINKRLLPEKLSGIYPHRTYHRKTPLVRGFDDVFYAPHSRNTEVSMSDIEKCKEVTVMADSEEAGAFLLMAEDGKKVFVMGHPEYDRLTLDSEYKRDIGRGLNPHIPVNYYPNDDPDQKPVLTWRGHANTLYTNWINYYVYQVTPYDLK